MRLSPRRLAALKTLVCAGALCVSACDGAPSGDGDAGVSSDGGGHALAEPPTWTCPDGWSRAADGSCEPWAADAACGPGEVRTPGDAACRLVGRACPSGDFPDDAPADALYVRSGAASGDGSRAAPFATIQEAIARAVSGSVVVVARGDYPEAVRLAAGVTLRGACASGTTLTAGSPVDGSVAVVTVTGEGARLEDVRLQGDRPGVHMGQDGAALSATLRGVLVEGTYATGIMMGSGATLDAEDVVVRGTRELTSPSGSLRYGMGVFLAGGARADFDRCAFLENRSMGAFVAVDSVATFHRTLIADTSSDSTGRFGRGLGVEGDGDVTLTESVVERNHDCGIHVATGSRLTVDGAVIRGTRPRTADAQLGCGLSVLDGAHASLTRVAVTGNHYYGIAVAGAESELTVEHGWVTGTESTDVGSGIGVLADAATQLSLSHVRLEENRNQGLLLRGTRVFLDHLTVAGTRSDLVDGDFGRGIEANEGAEVTGQRVRLEGNRDASLVAFDEGTSVLLQDVVVTDTLERACVDSLCAGLGAGTGVGVFLGASVELERFVIERSALAGAQLIDGALRLSDGEIRDNPIGVNLMQEGFDVAQIQDAVRYIDNERNIARESVGPVATPSSFGL